MRLVQRYHTLNVLVASTVLVNACDSLEMVCITHFFKFQQTSRLTSAPGSRTILPYLTSFVTRGIPTLIWAGDTDWICVWEGSYAVLNTVEYPQQTAFTYYLLTADNAVDGSPTCTPTALRAVLSARGCIAVSSSVSCRSRHHSVAVLVHLVV